MPHNRPHVIGKQVFEAAYHSSENGLAFRTDFTETIKKYLLPVIEEVLDELDLPGYLVRIEKLELELENIAYPFDEYLLKELLKNKLREELNFRIVSIRHRKQEKRAGEDMLIPLRKTEEELLLFFLRSGALPWWNSESKNFQFSVEELIDRLVEKAPKSLGHVLEKVQRQPAALQRFIFHIPEKTLFQLIESLSGIPVATLEILRDRFRKESFEKELTSFAVRYRQFFLSYFILQKKKHVHYPEVRLFFAEYLMEQRIVEEYQLVDLFPEHFLMQWVERNFPSYAALFRQYITKIQAHEKVESSKAYKTLFYSFLKNRSEKRTLLTETIAREMAVYSRELAEEIRRIEKQPTGFIEEELVRTTSYFEDVQNRLLNYLQYGIVTWEERHTGIQGIEALLLEWHEKYPDRLERLFSLIPLKHYPAVLNRLERSFRKEIPEMLFTRYFNKETALRQMDSVQYRKEILELFFEKGMVSWQEQVNNTIPVIEKIIKEYYEEDPARFVRNLRGWHEAGGERLKKAAFLFSEEFRTFLEDILSGEEDVPRSGLPDALALPSDPDTIVYYLSYFERYRMLPEGLSFSLEALVRLFVTQFEKESKLYFTLAAYEGYALLKQSFPPEVRSSINEWIRTEKPPVEIREQEQKLPGKKDPERPPDLTIEPVYIANAGLVLIHPFLQRFFSLCKLLEKRKFKDEASAHKAVHLLQYIVAKDDKREEHQLVLNKILCGIPLSEPVDQTIVLTEEEKEICESLISGVVENWPILKKTSNDNFRVSFLRREGRLLEDEKGWLLKVEERSFDMLLEKLPWSVSMFRLPWMEKMIQVEWH